MADSLNVNVPATAAIGVTVNREVIKTLEIDVSRFNAETVSYLFMYGLRQCLNDAKAGEKSDNAVAMVEKRLERLYAGTMTERASGGASAPVDPVARIARGIAEKVIKSAMMAKGIKPASVDKETMAKLVAQHAASEHVMSEARRQHEASIAIKSGGDVLAGMDLASLGIVTPGAATVETTAPDADAPATGPESDEEKAPAEPVADSETPAESNDDATPAESGGKKPRARTTR